MAHQAQNPAENERRQKVSFMLPPSLHKRVRIAAAQLGMFQSDLVEDILTRELDRLDKVETF